MPLTYSVDIAAPAAKVFALLDDPEQRKRWAEDELATEYLSEFDPRDKRGLRFRKTARKGDKELVMTGEYTAYEPPHHLAVRLVVADPIALLYDYQLGETGPTTRLDVRITVAIDVWVIRKFCELFFRWQQAGPIRRALQKLKAEAERNMDSA